MKNKLIDLGLLWLRVAFGLGMMYHGWGKITGDGGISGWADRSVAPMGFPLPIVFALLAVGSELIGGFFVVLGLWTRYAALACAVVVLTAVFVRLQLEPFSAREMASAYAVVAIAIIILGPGRYAVDGGKGGGKSAPAKKGK